MTRVNIQEIQPEAYKAMFGIEGYIAKSTIEKNLQELVRLRASLINGCRFCTGIHSEAAAKLGESKERIAAVSNWKESRLFTDKERAALAASDDITNIAEAGLQDATYKIVSEFFTEEEIAQLIMLCSIINAWNRMGISMAG